MAKPLEIFIQNTLTASTIAPLPKSSSASSSTAASPLLTSTPASTLLTSTSTILPMISSTLTSLSTNAPPFLTSTPASMVTNTPLLTSTSAVSSTAALPLLTSTPASMVTNTPLPTNAVSSTAALPLLTSTPASTLSSLSTGLSTATWIVTSVTPLPLTTSASTKTLILDNDNNLLNKTSADLIFENTLPYTALDIFGHIENVKTLVFSITGFFAAVFLGFVCYESFVVYRFCFKTQKQVEPIYETIPLKSLPSLKKSLKNPVKTSNSQIKESTELRPISPPLASLSFFNKMALLENFFSKKNKNVTIDQLAVTSADTETAKIHKPYVLAPSFVFNTSNDEVDVNNESFFRPVLSTTTVPEKSLATDGVALDFTNVMMSCTNENYMPPSSLPKLQPLLFHTFKRPGPLKKSVLVHLFQVLTQLN